MSRSCGGHSPVTVSGNRELMAVSMQWPLLVKWFNSETASIYKRDKMNRAEGIINMPLGS